ncbi:MAG TPA: hypothetical protein VGX97_07420 [bacterium]|nr:hypothetical protein [bacterium]
MRHFLLVGLLVTLVAAPAVVLAQPNSTLPVSGTMTPIGTLNGTTRIGGVTGTVTSSGGAWTMTVAGATFASGTYACSGGSCSYTGTVAGSTRTFGFTTNSTTGAISGATGFPTHGAWVSTVAHWSGGNKAALAAAGTNVGHSVSDAARFDRGGGGGGHGTDHDGGHGADKN